jgi:hypothetical protein
MRDFPVVPPPRRKTIAAAAAVVIAATALVVLVVHAGSSGRAACSSYPTPGAQAPAGAAVPRELTAKYSLFSEPQRAVDQLRPSQTASLTASGLIMSGTRSLGDSAGGRIYLVPAQHLLSLPLAPARCLSTAQRVTERESLPLLRNEYRQAALCILVLGGTARTQECAPASGTPYALLSSSSTPGFGLVPNGIHEVTVSYWAAPPRTVAVHRNSFVIDVPSQPAPPCGVQWLDPTGNVRRVVSGCSYLATEVPGLSAYRTYVSAKLALLRTELAALSSASGSGRVTAARSAWLRAHLTWLEIGQDDGAYGAFGALGGEIDGLAAGHPLGTSSPGFTGFHRVELDLWSKDNLRAAAADTAALRGLLARLMKAPLSSYLPASVNGIGNWLLRPHEVLEDALRDSLTAEDDYGSGTDLASITADVAAVRVMLDELSPTFKRIAPQLAGDAAAELGALLRTIDAGKRDRGWVSIQKLPIRQRQQIDAGVDAALQTLAPLPDLITSTGSNAPG